MNIEHRFGAIDAIITAQQEQIRALQAALANIRPCQCKCSAAGRTPRAPRKRNKPYVNPAITEALHRHFRFVPEAMDITELTAKEIIETLEFDGTLRLGPTPHVKTIMLARALAEFGAKPGRSQNRRFYRGIVRKTVGTE
jgi:hypothetical protein